MSSPVSRELGHEITFLSTGNASIASSAHWLKRNQKSIQAILCVLALTGSLMVYGILQERIMTLPFGTQGRKFKHTLFLVLCNRLIACSMAVIWIRSTGGQLMPVAPIHSYGLISVANVISSACQYEALKYVSFPVQVLAKCIKMIPVMVWQSIIARRRYALREYVEAAAVAMGCTLFLIAGDVTSTLIPGSENLDTALFVGFGILILYLAADGFTSTWQDWLFTGYNMDVGNQVLHTTLCSSFLSMTGLVMSGKWTSAVAFVRHYPEVWWWIMGISVASASVQFLVTHTIKEYGALVFAAVMTTRQWFSILLSCIVFGHPLTIGQWIGTVTVFVALYQRFYDKQRGEKTHESKIDS